MILKPLKSSFCHSSCVQSPRLCYFLTSPTVSLANTPGKSDWRWRCSFVTHSFRKGVSPLLTVGRGLPGSPLSPKYGDIDTCSYQDLAVQLPSLLQPSVNGLKKLITCLRPLKTPTLLPRSTGFPKVVLVSLSSGPIPRVSAYSGDAFRLSVHL